MQGMNRTENCLKIGICNGRGFEYNLELLARYGIEVKMNGDRVLTPTVTVDEKKALINRDVQKCTFTVILGKARDLTEWLSTGFIDVAVGYDMHLRKQGFRTVATYTKKEEDLVSPAVATVALVCRAGEQERLMNTRYVRRVASEFPEEVLKKSCIPLEDLVITHVSGSAEGLVTNRNLDFDMACTVVQTGETLKKNDMEVFQTLERIEPSIFIRRGRWSRALNYLLYAHFNLPIYVDGIDGSGKTTLVNSLKKLGLNVHDRGLLTKLTLCTQKEWQNVHLELAIYIVLDCDPVVASERVVQRDGKVDEWATFHRQYYYNRKFRALACRYGVYLIDTTNMNSEKLVHEVLYNLDAYLMPRIDKMTEQEIEKLEIVNEGNSKIVRRLNDKYDLVQYKPTVHSHKKQRAGIVAGTDYARMNMFRNMIEVLWANGIAHTTVYVGDSCLLVEHLDKEDIPNIEVIVKGYLTGTDKHRYYGMEKMNIFDGELHGVLRYARPYVRFDWRNPNHHPETGTPLGDEACAEGLAEFFINVENSRNLALKTYKCIGSYLREYCDIELLDICFMITQDGRRLFYEISPDCARLYKIHTKDSVDKDVWRSGGSSELVLKKWQEAGEITEQNLLRYLKAKDMF